MFGISSWEFAIIMIFVLIAFGPDKIPEIFKLLGKALKMFREAKSQVEEVTSQVIRPEDMETLKSLRDPLGTQELKNNVATLLDPLKEATAPIRESRSASANATSIWSSLAGPATPAEAAAEAEQAGRPAAEGAAPAPAGATTVTASEPATAAVSAVPSSAPATPQPATTPKAKEGGSNADPS